MKTVRFAEVVKRSGRPQPHTLWLSPDRDPRFSRALKETRVMTVGHGDGTQTDFGTIGFDRERASGGQLLIFPKSLRRFSGARVIGIKFDLVDQPPLEAGSLGTSREKRTAPTDRASPPPRATAPAPAWNEANPRRRTPPPARRRARAQPKEPQPSAPSTSAAPDPQFLVREIKAALRELEAGKTVAAFKRLQRALDAGDR